ncbi:MAG: hypothetical protein OHK0052_07530 [Anaerolineales bacterium]
MTTPAQLKQQNPTEYNRRIRAWTMYDWANSAFATTILAAVLPVYFSQVAGATLPSEAIATAYWSLGLSVSLLIIAILSPILGTISDVARGKKRLLGVFVAIGVLATAFLVLIETGDWLLASILAILGRIGFNGSIVFYDSLLPHVAAEEDQDRISSLGFALGYLGGGLLLAINIVMIFVLPGNWGARLSFFSVAIWWAVFSIPLFRQVPEPPSDSTGSLSPIQIIQISFSRIFATLRDLRRYRELAKFLLAFLIYNDGIGTIIGVAAIYGAELGFGSIELILALLLVQFAGIPFSLIFGSLPSANAKRRPFALALVIFNLIALPLVGISASRLLPREVTGMPLPNYETIGEHLGEGIYAASQNGQFAGAWEADTIPGAQIQPQGLLGFLNNPLGGAPADEIHLVSRSTADEFNFLFNGQTVRLQYDSAPDGGVWEVWLNGAPMQDEETGVPLTIDAYSPVERYNLRAEISAPAAGLHTLTLRNSAQINPQSTGHKLALAQIEVLKPARQNNLGLILGLVFAVQAIGLLFAWLTGERWFSNWVSGFDTKRSINLSLVMYAAIAVWGFFLNSTVEFWFLAWMVAVVQGGSQALSRSLYAALSPASKSGEFFGFFSVMEKFASLIGPLLFALAGIVFNSSRPAILSLIAFFIIGIVILNRVDVEAGRKVAHEEDARVAL